MHILSMSKIVNTVPAYPIFSPKMGGKERKKKGILKIPISLLLFGLL